MQFQKIINQNTVCQSSLTPRTTSFDRAGHSAVQTRGRQRGGRTSCGDEKSLDPGVHVRVHIGLLQATILLKGQQEPHVAFGDGRVKEEAA